MNCLACCNERSVVDRLAAFHRPSWRAALAGLAAPTLRLHRRREARARLLERALGARERE